MRESALVLYGGDLISVSRGQPSSVEFNFEEVWAYRKKLGKDFEPRSLMWVHVHPSSFGTQPSTVDELCAASLRAAFKSVEHFGILCFDNPGFQDFDGVISWYRFDGRFTKTREERLIDDNIILMEELYMLKALSYGELWLPKSESTGSVQSVQTSSSS